MERFSSVRTLYRRILRLHRTLPHPSMKILGDRYVKKEFRIHCADPFAPGSSLNPPTGEQWKMFGKSWLQYADQLEEQDIGIRMSRQQKATLTREQQLKLKELRDNLKGG